MRRRARPFPSCSHSRERPCVAYRCCPRRLHPSSAYHLPMRTLPGINRSLPSSTMAASVIAVRLRRCFMEPSSFLRAAAYMIEVGPIKLVAAGQLEGFR